MGKFSVSALFSTIWPMGGVLGGSLLIAWATEVLSFFLSRGMAFAVLALLQVLPEFAVEATITRHAALDPAQLVLVSANFTGANRMIVGLFLPFVFLMAWTRARRGGSRIRYVELPVESSIEIMALLVAIVYAFSFVIRGSIGLVDSVILIAIYGLYLLLMFRMPAAEEEEGELPLIPRTIRSLSIFRQKWVIALFFIAGGALLVFSVEPFYHNTVALGEALGLSSYFLIQWIAPFLSEFPEFITIAYWGRTGRAQLGVTNAISSNVNQLTLLIAMIPIVYVGTTYAHHHPILNVVFEPSQRLEILLTAAQALFAACALLNLRFHRWEAVTLFCLWAVQLFDPLIDRYVPTSWPHFFPTPIATADNLHPYTQYVREYCAYVFLALVPVVLITPKKRFAAFRGFGTVWRTHLASPPVPPDVH